MLIAQPPWTFPLLKLPNVSSANHKTLIFSTRMARAEATMTWVKKDLEVAQMEAPVRAMTVFISLTPFVYMPLISPLYLMLSLLTFLPLPMTLMLLTVLALPTLLCHPSFTLSRFLHSPSKIGPASSALSPQTYFYQPPLRFQLTTYLAESH
jgi:hypothetical protein